MRYILFLYCVAVLVSSCKKNFLDRKPLDQYSESSLWGTAADATAALNGCYNRWESGAWLFYMDCGSDNAYNAYPWEGWNMFGNMSFLTPNNPGDHKWNFTTIQRCNWFLSNIDKVSMDEALRARMKAEVKCLRAYKYLIMSQLYGDVPLITTNIDIAEANKITRTGKDSVVHFVISEFAAAAADLPESYSGSDVGRFTKGAAWSLKARAELYNQKYADCAASCEQVIGKYSLFSSYPDLFRIKNENNPEIILDVQYLKDYVVPEWEGRDIGVMVPVSAGGWWSIDPTQALVDAYEMKNGKTIDETASGYDPENPYANRDPRLAATVIVPGSLYDGNYFDPYNPNNPDYYLNEGLFTGYGDRKYVSQVSDFDDIWNSGLNIPVVRYAEILLTYAEAKVELNQIDQSVYDAINKVRIRAGMPAVTPGIYNGQAKMRELVRRERRVELAMEGLRWFDVQRWKIAEQVMNGPVYGCRLGTVNPSNGKLTLTNNKILVEQRVFNPAKNYLWPIPQSEMDINKNLKQNPGY